MSKTRTAVKDRDINRDVGQKKNRRDLVKPPRSDRKKPFVKRDIPKEDKDDYKDTVFDKDLMASDKNIIAANAIIKLARKLSQKS